MSTKRKSAYIKAKSWADYGLTEREYYDTRKLRTAVRKAAKAANQRMLRLERAGKTAGVYKMAQKNLSRLGRRRFRENTDKLSVNELRHEYAILRDFLIAKTSTIQGARDTDDKRYEKARSRGFSGTQSQWNELVIKYFTSKVEELFSSDVIYRAITSNETDVIDEVMRGTPKTQGEALTKYLKGRQRKHAKV